MAAKQSRMKSMRLELAKSAPEKAEVPEEPEQTQSAVVAGPEPTPEPEVGEGSTEQETEAQPAPEPEIQTPAPAPTPLPAPAPAPQQAPVQEQARLAPVQQPFQPPQQTIVRPVMLDTSRTDTMGHVRILAATLNRKEVRMRSNQFATLTELVRAINRERTMKIERITENTILRIALDAFIRDYGQTISGNSENELRQSIGLDPTDLV